VDEDKSGLGDELFGTPMADAGLGPVSGHVVREAAANAKPGDLIPPLRSGDGILEDGDDTGIPDQEEFFRSPARFGSIPVDKEPLGWDRRQKFNKLYPFVSLPTQVVERVSFGHPELEPNRLLWGDNLHVMRQLPSESIDLIYIDPPFFSGRQYNVIFGDKNEMRSFSDIWDAGMPGYLEWLNARVFEMKRLLHPAGSICLHLDWHAGHYAKAELDKIFGYSNFVNEIIWAYKYGGRARDRFGRKHDTILVYRKSTSHQFFLNAVRVPHEKDSLDLNYKRVDESGRHYREGRWKSGKVYRYYADEGRTPDDVWTDINSLHQAEPERIGYPTQKPERLIERFALAFTKPGDVVADFFLGGGTTAAVAQRLGRRWIGCDQSRVAVAVAANRLAGQAEQANLQNITGGGVPDFTIEHWGTYEAARLSQAPPDQFRRFLIDAAQLRQEARTESPIHAFKGQLPIWIGPPDRNHRVTAQEVVDFANAVRRLETFRQGTLREARMIAWAFSPAAQQQAAAISEEKHSSSNYLDIELVRIESEAFREHIVRLSSDKADYGTFLTFTRPPEIVTGRKHVEARTWRFDVSDTLVANEGAKLINVQWDFDYRDGRFTSSLAYKDLRHSDGRPKLVVEWTFPGRGEYEIACKVQDDMGGEGFYTERMTVDV
jgi:DNA modification methylase